MATAHLLAVCLAVASAAWIQDPEVLDALSPEDHVFLQIADDETDDILPISDSDEDMPDDASQPPLINLLAVQAGAPPQDESQQKEPAQAQAQAVPKAPALEVELPEQQNSSVPTINPTNVTKKLKPKKKPKPSPSPSPGPKKKKKPCQSPYNLTRDLFTEANNRKGQCFRDAADTLKTCLETCGCLNLVPPPPLPSPTALPTAGGAGGASLVNASDECISLLNGGADDCTVFAQDAEKKTACEAYRDAKVKKCASVAARNGGQPGGSVYDFTEQHEHKLKAYQEKMYKCKVKKQTCLIATAASKKLCMEVAIISKAVAAARARSDDTLRQEHLMDVSYEEVTEIATHFPDFTTALVSAKACWAKDDFYRDMTAGIMTRIFKDWRTMRKEFVRRRAAITGVEPNAVMLDECKTQEFAAIRAVGEFDKKLGMLKLLGNACDKECRWEGTDCVSTKDVDEQVAQDMTDYERCYAAIIAGNVVHRLHEQTASISQKSKIAPETFRSFKPFSKEA